MIFQKVHTRRFRNEAGDGSDGAGGGAPDVAAQLAEMQKQMEALKSNKDEILREKKRVQSEFDQFKSNYEGIDPDAVRGILKRFSDDEEAALIAKGEVDTVLARRTEKMQQSWEKKLTAAEQEKQALANRAKAFESKVLDNSVLQAATKVGLHQHAIEDALFRGRSMFRLDENGDAVAVDAEGNVLMGKDGKSPYTPAEWLEDMKEKAPHWFPAPANGGGAKGGYGGVQNKGSLGGSKDERVTAIKNKFPGLHG